MGRQLSVRYVHHVFIPLVLLILGCALSPLFASEYTFLNRLGRADGLLESHIFCIMKDQIGFMWFGSRDGLFRYDGYEMVAYRGDLQNPQTLSNNYIYAMVQDDEGMIWLGTRGGLNRFDPSQDVFKHFRHDPEDKTSLSDDAVRAVAIDPNTGGLWIGTMGGGLNRFDLQGQTFQHFRAADNRGLPGDEIRVVAADRERVWVGTTEGLAFMWQDEPGRFIPKSNRSVHALHVAPSGDVWFASPDQLFHLPLGSDGRTPVAAPVPVFPDPAQQQVGTIWAITSDRFGAIWLGTSQEGVFSIQPDGKPINHWSNEPGNPNSLGGNNVNVLFIDETNICWVGSHGQGITKITPTRFGRAEVLGEVGCLLMDRNGALWRGGTQPGLIRMDRQGVETRFQEPGLTDDPVSALYQDSRGTIWIGTENIGVTRYQPQIGVFRNMRLAGDQGGGNQVRCFAESGDTLWVGSMGGLGRTSLGGDDDLTYYRAESSNPRALSHDFIACLQRNAAGDSLWIGTWFGGLNRMRTAEPGVFEHFRHRAAAPDSISSDAVPAIYEDSRGILWLGTAGGLNRFDPESGVFRTYVDGLPANTIYQVLADQRGRLWLSTTNGLSCFDPISGVFRNYDHHDGLAVEDFRRGCGLVDERGFLYFGGSGGWVHFNPEEILKDSSPAGVALVGLDLDNKPAILKRLDPQSPLRQTIPFARELALSHAHRSLELRFAALRQTAPEKNRYAYIMEGYDQGWIFTDAGDRHASYMNLSPKTYYFRVKAGNKDGVWGPTTGLAIHIPTPPWRSWWALTAYFLLIASMIFSYVLGQRRKLRYERTMVKHLQQVDLLKDQFNRDLEHKVSVRTRELNARNQELETLDKIVQAINRERELEGVLEAILAEALTLVPSATAGTVLLWNMAENRAEIAATFGYQSSDYPEIRLTPDQVVARYTQGTQQIADGIFLCFPSEDSPAAESLKKMPLPQSILAIALNLDNRLEGYLTLSNGTDRHAFEQTEVHKLGRFRDHALMALAKARNLRDLLTAQQELNAAAHEAGMAEIASEVLHHVGNALNSVKTSATLIQEEAGKDPWLRLLERALELFRDESAWGEAELQRNRRLGQLLQRGAGAVRKQQEKLISEACRLDAGLVGIHAMLNQQHRLSQARKFASEPANINQLIEESLRAVLPRNNNLCLIKEMNPIPPVALEVHRFRRLLFFMLEHALTSIAASGRDRGLLRVITDRREDRVRLAICDNGSEILDMNGLQQHNLDAAPEWFGMHYCANVIKEMSGTILLDRNEQGENRILVTIPHLGSKAKDR